jgi:uridine kinase
MKGDILIIDENHRKAANQIVEMIFREIKNHDKKYVVSIGGESGAGKSEIAVSVRDELEKRGVKCYIFGQDDYFILPPKTNAQKREQDISWVGMQEVKLDLLDQNLDDACSGNPKLIKPLVDFNADRIENEIIDLTNMKVLIIEGTYTTALKNLDCRIFIDRNKSDTIESRKKRAREKQDEFLEKILSIEHSIISNHKNYSDIIITKSFDAIKNPGKIQM